MSSLSDKLSSQTDYEYHSVRAITFSKGYTKILQITLPTEYADGTYSWRVVIKSGTSDSFNSSSPDVVNTSGTITSVNQSIELSAGITQALTPGNYVMDIVLIKDEEYLLYGRYDVRSLKPNFTSASDIIPADTTFVPGQLIYLDGPSVSGIYSASNTAFSDTNRPVDRGYFDDNVRVKKVNTGVHFTGYDGTIAGETTISSLATIETDVQHTFDFVLLFQIINPSGSYTLTNWNTKVKPFLDAGRDVVLNFELMGTHAQINAGAFDNAINQLGGYITAYKQANPNWRGNFGVKLLHEMNLTTSYSWCVFTTANLTAAGGSLATSIANFKTAFNRVSGNLRTAATLDGECLVKIIWEIGRDNNSGNAEPIQSFAVDNPDIVSINNYNRYFVSSGYAYWLSFEESLKRTLNEVTRLYPGKPVMIGETATTSGGKVSDLFTNAVTISNGGSGFPASQTNATLPASAVTADGTKPTFTYSTNGSGVVTSITVATTGEENTFCTIAGSFLGGTGLVTSVTVRGARLSKPQWYVDALDFIKNNSAIDYVTFFWENKDSGATDYRDWAPNSAATKTAVAFALDQLNKPTKAESYVPTRINRNLWGDPFTNTLASYTAAGTNAGSLSVSTAAKDLPVDNSEVTQSLLLSHNGTVGTADSNYLYFTIPSGIAPNQQVTITFDAKYNFTEDATAFIQVGLEMVDAPNTFEKNIPAEPLNRYFKSYRFVTSNGQTSTGGYRVAFRIGQTDAAGSLCITNIKVELGEEGTPLLPGNLTRTNQANTFTAPQTFSNGFYLPIRDVAGTVTISTGDEVFYADSTSGAATINLPASATATSQILAIKRKNAAGNTITIDPNSSEQIEESTTYTGLSQQGDSVILSNNGSRWRIIASHFADTVRTSLENTLAERLNLSKVLRFSSFANSGVEGEVWYEATSKAVAAFFSGIKQTLVGTLFTQTGSGTVGNSSSELTLFASGTGSRILPANFFTVAKTVRVRVRGLYGTQSTPGTLTFRVKLGSTTMVSSTAITLPASQTNAFFEVNIDMTCRAVGTSPTGAVTTQGYLVFTSGSAGASVMYPLNNTTSTVVDTTVSQTLDITAQWSAANASDTLTSRSATVEVLN